MSKFCQTNRYLSASGVVHSQTCVQWSLLGNDKVTVIIQGDCYMYIQVNFSVENKKKLKILGSCLVTVIYRVTTTYRAAIYRSTLQKI